MNDNTDELLAHEVLAFELYRLSCGAEDKENERDLWQRESASKRQEFRTGAQELVFRLGEAGVSLKVKKNVREMVEWIRTVPPRRAYSDDEIGLPIETESA